VGVLPLPAVRLVGPLQRRALLRDVEPARLARRLPGFADASRGPPDAMAASGLSTDGERTVENPGARVWTGVSPPRRPDVHSSRKRFCRILGTSLSTLVPMAPRPWGPLVRCRPSPVS